MYSFINLTRANQTFGMINISRYPTLILLVEHFLSKLLLLMLLEDLFSKPWEIINRDDINLDYRNGRNMIYYLFNK